MTENTENQGYVVEGKMTELTKGFLVLWTIRSGQMSYENMEDLQGITLDVRKTNICTFFSYSFVRSDSKHSLI